MAFPIFRFTLSNDIEGSLVISEPGGWDEALLKLERNQKYHSLVEFYEQPLTFYGSDSIHNGGLDYIRNIEQTQGVDADIEILIEIDFGSGYETLFTGLLDLSQLKEIDAYKADIPVVKDNKWTKFINRTSTPINIRNGFNLDGQLDYIVPSKTIKLTNQVLPLTYSARNTTLAENLANIISYAVYTLTSTNQYAPIDLPIVDIGEIQRKYNYPLTNNSLVNELFEIEWPGDYEFDFTIVSSGGNNPTGALGTYVNANVQAYIQINDGTPTAFSRSNTGTDGVDGKTTFTYTGTAQLDKGDFVYLYFQLTSGLTATFAVHYEDTDASLMQIIGNTYFKETELECVFAHDILRSLIEQTSTYGFYSDFFGGSLVDSDFTYSSDGCGYPFVVAKGLHIREYSLTQKPFYASFDDLWNGFDPIFCLGLGYETSEASPETEVLRIENREHFYDSSSNSVNLDYVDNIERSYANDLIFKKIEIGYEKWESENISGIDDPQTKHTYATNFRKVGEEITLYSKFIAASYAIESTRRKSVEKTKDYRLDNDTFIIAINPDASPIEPELDQYFSSVTNLNNSDSRYNLRITPYWNFTNWLKWFASSFTPLTAADWTFQRGEGNVLVTYNSNGGCLVNYGANPHNEDDDISLANTALTGTTFDIKVIEFEHPLTWAEYKSIRENRNLSIGVSETNTGHESYFILSLEYQITKGKAKFKLLKAGYQTLSTTFDSTVSTFDSTVLTFDQE